MNDYLTPLQQQTGVSADKTFVDEVGAFLAAHGIEGKEPSLSWTRRASRMVSACETPDRRPRSAAAGGGFVAG